MRKAVLRGILVGSLLMGVVLGVPSLSDAATRVYVRVGPPAPIVEVRGHAPGPRYVWVGGYHRWNGRAYVWAPGRWVVPPYRHAVWVAPHYVHGHRGWYSVGGYWRH